MAVQGKDRSDVRFGHVTYLPDCFKTQGSSQELSAIFVMMWHTGRLTKPVSYKVQKFTANKNIYCVFAEEEGTEGEGEKQEGQFG